MINIELIKKEICRQVKFFNEKGYVPEAVFMCKEIYDILEPELDGDMKIFGMDVCLKWLSEEEVKNPELAVGFNGGNYVNISHTEISKLVESIPEEFRKIKDVTSYCTRVRKILEKNETRRNK